MQVDFTHFAEYSERGFQVFPGAVSPVRIRELREESSRLADGGGIAGIRNLASRSPLLADLARSRILRRLLPASDLAPVRGILFDKTRDANWPVAWHQDLTITVRAKRETPGYGPWSIKAGVPHVRPPRYLLEGMATLRIHLDETDESNGALRVIPGSHRLGILPEAEVHPRESDAVVVSCHPGDVLLMCPLLLHASRRSLSEGRRRIVHLEYARRDRLAPALAWAE